MLKILELLITPPVGERQVHITHSNELVTLDKVSYEGDLPVLDYGISPEALKDLPDIPPPRANTYVLNLKHLFVEGDAVDGDSISLHTNYTNQRSKFALPRWLPLLPEEGEEKKIILQHLLPIAGAMILETSDEKIVIEERGSNVEMPGKYMVAPAGGCETRNWQVMPDLFMSIKGEAWEEIGLLPGEDYDAQIQFIGLVRAHTDVFCAIFTYYAKTHLTFDEVTKLAESIAPEASEHQRLLSAPVEFSELLSFCSSYEENIMGSGLGNLLTFGYHRHGESWLELAREKLQEKDWNIVCHKERFPSF